MNKLIKTLTTLTLLTAALIGCTNKVWAGGKGGSPAEIAANENAVIQSINDANKKSQPPPPPQETPQPPPPPPQEN